jgi:hypothetical protein
MRDGFCRSAICESAIEIWATPKGKFMPFTVEQNRGGPDDILIPHFATCPEAAKFRTKGAA